MKLSFIDGDQSYVLFEWLRGNIRLSLLLFCSNLEFSQNSKLVFANRFSIWSCIHNQTKWLLFKTCSNNISITCNEKSLSRISAVWIRLMRAFLVTLIMIFCKFYRKSENLTQINRIANSHSHSRDFYRVFFTNLYEEWSSRKIYSR